MHEDVETQEGDRERRMQGGAQNKGHKIKGHCFVDIPHCKQKSDWDCGVACIRMIAPNAHNLRNLKITRIWTIDLCYLLAELKVPHVYYTTTLGVHKCHRSEAEERERIEGLFRVARFNCLEVRKKQLPLVTLLGHLRGGRVAIVLCDANLLRCHLCQPHGLDANEEKKKRFLGHYVVLCGFNCSNGSIYYKNPRSESGEFFYHTLYISGPLGQTICGKQSNIVLDDCICFRCLCNDVSQIRSGKKRFRHR